MQIILLDETRFGEYAHNHPNKNYFQTTSYGKMMSKHGNNAYYLGLTSDSGEIKAATLLIVKNDNSNKRKIAYAPRGFLIDWTNKSLVEEFTNCLKDFLLKRNFTHIKVDPNIIYKEHSSTNIDDIIVDNGTTFVSNMQSLGYIHLGYNNSSETNYYRWDCMMELDDDIKIMFNKLKKDSKRKIKEAANKGLKVYKGSAVDINLLSTLSNNISSEQMMDYYQFYGDDFEIFFIKIEPYNFVNNSKNLYEREEANNAYLNELIQNPSIPDKNQYINKKIESDKLVAQYKKNMQDASNMFQTYPNGIIIGAIVIIKNGDTITVIKDYENEKFREYHPGYLLKWQLMQEYAKKGYRIFQFGGIELQYEQNSLMKQDVDLSNKIIEYYGEFDLVINKKAYYTGNKLNPILNWLNTPIN